MAKLAEPELYVSQDGLQDAQTLSRRELYDCVTEATRWIAPLWPIHEFAARSPWMDLEDYSFHEMAVRMNSTRKISIYPSLDVIDQARMRHEINDERLQERFDRWFNTQQLDLSSAVARRYGLAALRHRESAVRIGLSPETEQCAREWLGDPDLTVTSNATIPRATLLARLGDPKPAALLNTQMIKWCKLYLGDSMASWVLPYRQSGLYGAWRKLAARDPALPRAVRKRLAQSPIQSIDGLHLAISRLDIPRSELVAYLAEHLLCLPGWSGMLRWQSDHGHESQTLITDYLAIRLCTEWALTDGRAKFLEAGSGAFLIGTWVHQWQQWGGLSASEWNRMTRSEQRARLLLSRRLDDTTKGRLWLEAWEDTYADELKQSLMQRPPSPRSTRPIAQFLFCIDVRSEPIRRHLESAGPFETFGIAGFFGLPVAVLGMASSDSHPSLPVIATPRHLVREIGSSQGTEEYVHRAKALGSLKYVFKGLKSGSAGGLLLPDALGPGMALYTVLRQTVPRRIQVWLRVLANRALRRPSRTQVAPVTVSEVQSQIGLHDLSCEAKSDYVFAALQSIGLTRRFAPLVVVCGHGAETTNNLYAAKLHCGACGGVSGKWNAQLFAALCNEPDVRRALRARGIHIPPETTFAAAEHVTTVDELRWQTLPKLSPLAKASFERIGSVWPGVQQHVVAERLRRMPQRTLASSRPLKEAAKLAVDWSEVRPEWGLARNAALVIAPRARSLCADLQGRAFLHSYDWKTDVTGDILRSILAGPGTVAQWINLQYYASTVVPEFYGSGSKTSMTATSGLGVMQGNGSDLLSGLPRQSVMSSHDIAYHSPIRLLLVIEIPKDRMHGILQQSPSIQRKLMNGWIHMAIIDPETGWDTMA